MTLEIVTKIERIGGHVFLEGDRLKARIPESHPEAGALVEELRTNKAEVMRLLRENEVLPGADLIEPERCCACRGYLFWLSVYGVKICCACHPPASPRLVRAWFWGNMPARTQ
jgi:hypothetical protein